MAWFAWVALALYVLGALMVWFVASFAGDDAASTTVQTVILWPVVALFLLGWCAWDVIRPLAKGEKQ